VHWLLVILHITIFSFCAHADEPLTDPRLEKQAQELFTQVKCVVCQASVIKESTSEFSIKTRAQIRQQIALGKKPEQILDDLRKQYGAEIVTKPEVSRYTFLLWFLPWLILVGGIYFISLRVNGRKN
jgi:cytochrome c-type biogenesis protein CcmH